MRLPAPLPKRDARRDLHYEGPLARLDPISQAKSKSLRMPSLKTSRPGAERRFEVPTLVLVATSGPLGVPFERGRCYCSI
jgi:hypothetical protein